MKLAHSQAIQNSTLINPEGIVFDSSVASHAFTFGGLSGAGNLALQDNAGSPNAVALTVGNNNVSTTHSGILSGGGSFTKIGTGRLILTGPNTYTGATVVSNGMLVINGVIASATAVKSNATLGWLGHDQCLSDCRSRRHHFSGHLCQQRGEAHNGGSYPERRRHQRF